MPQQRIDDVFTLDIPANAGTSARTISVDHDRYVARNKWIAIGYTVLSTVDTRTGELVQDHNIRFENRAGILDYSRYGNNSNDRTWPLLIAPGEELRVVWPAWPTARRVELRIQGYVEETRR